MNPSMKVWLTKKEINRLTNDYKQQLEAMANNMRHPGFMPGLLPFVPPNLIPNQPDGIGFPNTRQPQQNQFIPSQPDYYAEFMRLQLQFQRDQELQRQMFSQRPVIPPSTQGSQVTWSTGDQASSIPTTSRASEPPINSAVTKNSSTGQGGSSLQSGSLFSNTENGIFSQLNGDLFAEIDSSQPMRASSSFFDSLSQLTNVEEDLSSQFLSLYSDEEHIWKPIDEADVNTSLWPDLNSKKKEE